MGYGFNEIIYYICNYELVPNNNTFRDNRICANINLSFKKMKTEMKDTVEVVAANGGALGLTLMQANEILQFVSLSLAIAFTIYKFIKKKK